MALAVTFLQHIKEQRTKGRFEEEWAYCSLISYTSPPKQDRALPPNSTRLWMPQLMCLCHQAGTQSALPHCSTNREPGLQPLGKHTGMGGGLSQVCI